MNKYGVTDIRVKTALDPLDKKYELRCDCGWYVDLGYMWATAEHMYGIHKQRYPDHLLDMIVFDAKPLPSREIQHRLYLGKVKRAVTIRVEPGLT